jgi:hypothetical protein
MRARRRDHHPRGPAESAGGPPAGGPPAGGPPGGGADRPRDGGPRSGRRRKRGSGSASDTAQRPATAPRPTAGAAPSGAPGAATPAGKAAPADARTTTPTRGARRKDRNRRPKVDALSFWGDAAALPTSEADVRLTDDPGAVSRSLGTPPLPGQEVVAPHYFAAVYERAVMTAGALAAAGGLIDTETLAEELEH